MISTELFRFLDLQTFVAFDFETTGLDINRDKIIECAAVRFINGKVSETFSTLVNPGIFIPSYITNLTGITNEMVKEAPSEQEVYQDLIKFIGSDPLVAHNIEFDIAILKKMSLTYSSNTTPVNNILYDTLLLAQTFLYFLPNHRLGTVADYFGYSKDESHRAKVDTINVGKIFIQLVEEAASYPLSTFQKILAVIRDFSIPTKQLFINLANLLSEKQRLKSGLIPSKILKPQKTNKAGFHGSTSLLPDSAEKVFGKGGYLERTIEQELEQVTPFEERPTQIKFSELVLKILEEKSIGILEAGTGLGKSLAYLFPALKCALEKKNGPTIISCHTKHLQDQLFNQELPKIATALDISFKAVLMKGRQNYICQTRLQWVIEDARNLLSSKEAASLLPIIVWLEFTQTGNLSECPGFLNRQVYRLKSMIASDMGYCTRKICDRYHGCFVGPLRQAAQKADIIVVNHSLLLSELSNPGILPEFHRVVLDEAHNLVSVSYHHFQVRIDNQAIKDTLSPLNPKTRAGKKIKRQLSSFSQSNSEILNQFDHLVGSVESVLKYSEIFFRELIHTKGSRFKRNLPYVQHVRYRSFKEEFESEVPLLINLSQLLENCIEQITYLIKLLRNLDPSQVISESILLLERTQGQISNILEILMKTTLDEREDWVYWYEGNFIKGDVSLSLNGVPIDIGEKLGEQLFKTIDSVVLTSATLSIGHSFDYFVTRVGLRDFKEKRLVVDYFASPFLYEEQCQYFQFAGSIAPRSDQFVILITDLIDYLNKKLRKRMMVLFTSRALLESCYQEIGKRGLFRKLDVYAQIGSTSRTSLLDGFKQSKSGILLGTNSFWEGVDLPRDLLEILVITKLPFDVPDEPLIQAYSERLAKLGKNPFTEYSVPETAIKLKQGFGRLIRSLQDEGIFINLDHRVVNKRYGISFQEAIPVPMKTFFSVEEI